jgi:NADP-dependent 3-hydroxy acid dehydrogenase YdfG
MRQSKVWFITGASRGFGRIWTQAALERGDKVVATARNLEALRELQQQYEDSMLCLKLDVTRRQDIDAAVDAAYGRFGRLDVVISNAGYGYMGAIEELSLDDLRANFETNVLGTVSLIQAVLPGLRARQRGHIITLSSIGGVLSFPTGGGYTATKFAVEALTEALVGEVKAHGIHVTMLEPGSYATGFRSSQISATTMPEYDSVRAAIRAGFKPENTGDPHATVQALFALVDAERPPLRLLLGSQSLSMIEQAYAKRLSEWREWADLANIAQG